MRIAFASPYSIIDTTQQLQFHLLPAHLHLPFWSFPRKFDIDASGTASKMTQLYDDVISLIPFTEVINTPSSSPIICSNNNDNKYSNTQVILIGVLPVCLLFVLIVVWIIHYIYSLKIIYII